MARKESRQTRKGKYALENTFAHLLEIALGKMGPPYGLELENFAGK